MTKSLIIIGVITGVIGLGIVGCRHRFSHNHSPEEKAEYIVAKISSKLDLDENQKTRLNKIKDEILEKAKPHRESREEFRREALELLRSDKITEEGVEKLVAKKEAVYKEIRSGNSWRLVRKKIKICQDCLYNQLCPPLSNYEYAIGKNNLCHVWKE